MLTDDEGERHIKELGQLFANLGALHSQLPCRCQDQHPRLRTPALVLVHQALQDGNHERGGLAGTRDGGPEDVQALETRWDGLFLDGGGFGEAEGLEGAEDGSGEVHG